MAEKTEYAELTVDELKAELEKRELPKSGKKAELITRLEDDDTAQGGTAPENEAAAEPAADAADAEADAPEEKPAPKRRASEVSAPAKTRDRSESAGEAPRDKAGAIAVRAQARYVRSAPRKARLVMDHIRGKEVAEARAILRHTTRSAATDIAKLLESAVANAENNFELDPDELKVGTAFVDEGPTIKRFRPRAQGRATPIHKRTSHMTITLTTSGKDA
jgi:ribosomal protein L22